MTDQRRPAPASPGQDAGNLFLHTVLHAGEVDEFGPVEESCCVSVKRFLSKRDSRYTPETRRLSYPSATETATLKLIFPDGSQPIAPWSSSAVQTC